jgi:inner membrane protein
MASPFSHAVAAVAIGGIFEMPTDACMVGAAISILPDIDVFWMPFGLPDDSLFGHRMFTHSLLFAALVATALQMSGIRRLIPHSSRGTLWLYLFLAIASHGILDTFTDAGLGVALFAPFTGARYSSPFQPLHVSPTIARTPFTWETVQVTASELIWIWIPSLVLIAARLVKRRGAQSVAAGGL